MTLRDRVARAVGPRAWRKAGDLRDAARYAAFRRSKRGRDIRTRLELLRDAHRGERCVIIGNGPSLAKMDLAPLRHETTFAMNRGYLLAEKLGFHSTYLTAANDHVIAQWAQEIAATPAKKILTMRAQAVREWGPDTSFFYSRRRQRFFGDVARDGLWEGATITYATLQLAYFMGFKDVALIGVDHSFSTTGPAHKLVTADAPDPNHFDPRYFGPGFRWQLPDLETSERAYALAHEAFRSAGRRVVDATQDGKLDIFPKVRFEEWIKAPRAGTP